MRPSVCATVVLVKPSGEILMQLRDDGNGRPIPFPNMWNLPGGAAENAESGREAAVREMQEEFEISLEPHALKQIYAYSHPHAGLDMIYASRVPQDLDPPLHEGAALGWKTVDELENLPLGFEQWRALPAIASYVRDQTAH